MQSTKVDYIITLGGIGHCRLVNILRRRLESIWRLLRKPTPHTVCVCMLHT